MTTPNVDDDTFLKMSFDRKKRDVEAEKATADSKTTLLLPHRRKHLELDAEFEAQCKKDMMKTITKYAHYNHVSNDSYCLGQNAMC